MLDILGQLKQGFVKGITSAIRVFSSVNLFLQGMICLYIEKIEK